jgi:hypothetical protein
MTSKLTRSLVGAATGAGAVGVILALAGVHSPARTALVIVFLAVAPTAAIAGLLRGFDPFARIILAVVSTLVLLSIVAMILLSSGLWSPIGELVAVGAITLICLAAQRPSVRARVVAWARPPWQALLRHIPDIRQRPGGHTTAEPASEPQAEARSVPGPQSGAGPGAELAEVDPAEGTEVTTPLPAIHD